MSQNKMKNRSANGFTLLEILVALFIFTIVSIIMTHALHIIFANQATTEQRAARLANLQTTLLLVSRDIEQAIDRPITNSEGAQEPAFIGTKKSINFTHAGLANPLNKLHRSTLQRTEYALNKNSLVRKTWPVLDQAQTSLPDERELLSDVSDLNFEYIDEKNNTVNAWPQASQLNAPSFPRAVRITLTLKQWGKISQLYIITGQGFENAKSQFIKPTR